MGLQTGRMWIECEYISQTDGHVELKLTTICDRVCGMLNGEKFTGFLRNSLWADASNTAILLEYNLVTPNKGLSPYQQLFEREKEASCLQCKNLVK